MTALYSEAGLNRVICGRIMSDIEDTYEAASERLDRAFQRLEASVRSLNGRMRTHARIEADTQKLLAERARFAGDLDKASARARRLDEASAEVARRLVDAMDTVNDVLANG
jgi:ABC-type transporter Mla subunit MlaD